MDGKRRYRGILLVYFSKILYLLQQTRRTTTIGAAKRKDTEKYNGRDSNRHLRHYKRKLYARKEDCRLGFFSPHATL